MNPHSLSMGNGRNEPGRGGLSKLHRGLIGAGVVAAVLWLIASYSGSTPSSANRMEPAAGGLVLSETGGPDRDKASPKSHKPGGTPSKRDGISRTDPFEGEKSISHRRSHDEQPAASQPDVAPWEYSEKLIKRLLALKDKKSLSPEQLSGSIKGILASLAMQGQDGVAAIHDYLATGEDLDYDEVKVNGRVFDRKTARMGLLETLKNIGGTEATELLVSTLQNTVRPEEIGMLAGMLDKQWPGLYRQAALSAAYQGLARAAQGQLGGRDVGPLFQVYANFGDEQAIAGLEQYVSRWPRYAATALAYAPNGAGVPGLLHIYESTPDQSLKETVVQLMAQTASRNPPVLSALLEGIDSQQIQVPDYLWPKLAEALRGNYNFQLVRPKIDYLPAGLKTSPYRHILYGNLAGMGRETVYITDVSSLTAEDVEARLAVIDRMLSADLNRTAVAALENARESLLRRVASP